MARSAPKVLAGEANRLKTDQLWLQYIITVNSQAVDIRGMGFGLEAEALTRGGPPISLPTTIEQGEEEEYNIVQLLTQTPGAAGLGSITLRTKLEFAVRLYMAGNAGQITLYDLALTIDPKRTDNAIYDEGGLYPEVFHINILTDADPEEIEGELQWPGLSTAGFSRIESLSNFGALAALPAPVRDTFYNLSATQTIDGKEYAAGLYFRSTAGAIIPISTTIIPLPE